MRLGPIDTTNNDMVMSCFHFSIACIVYVGDLICGFFLTVVHYSTIVKAKKQEGKE